MKRFIFILNLIVIFFLLLSYLAAYVPPDGFFWWLQLIGMAYGILLTVNIAFIILWLLLRNRRFIWSFLTILIGYSRILSVYEIQIVSHKNYDEESLPLKVMTFNVRLFDLYNWFHNTETRSKIFDFLKKESPDIVCFQEYYHSDGPDVNTSNNNTVKAVIPAPYAHIEYTKTLHEYDHWGIATFSKYPIIHKQKLEFKNNRFGNLYIYSDIVVGKDTLRIINAHLESIHFGSSDYKYLEKIQNEVDKEDLAGGIKILKSLRRAYAYRMQQVKSITATVSESPYPVVLCGDFNDTPSSYTYHQLVSSLKDSFRESGSGVGNTYAGPFPSFRIDYILHSKALVSTKYSTYRVKLSDHYPIMSTLRRRK